MDASQTPSLGFVLKTLSDLRTAGSSRSLQPLGEISSTRSEFAWPGHLDHQENVQNHQVGTVQFGKEYNRRISGSPESASLLDLCSRSIAGGEGAKSTQVQAGFQTDDLSSDATVQDIRTTNPTCVIEPSNITNWRAGLRYMTKAVTFNDKIGISIKRMISSQHEHEQQWFSGREALIQRQKDREDGKRKLDDVLRAVGGNISVEANTPDMTAELVQYDRKVYDALIEMTIAMSAELRALKVPFFCMRPSLVKENKASDQGREDKPDFEDGKLEQAELLKLKRRMLEFLEDMFKD